MPQEGTTHRAIVIVGILLIASICYAGMRTPRPIPENYCEMLELNCRTGGEKGHGDYRGIAEEHCYKK